MRKFLFALMLIPLAFCTKPEMSDEQGVIVTVEATSKTVTSIDVPSVFNDSFEGSFKRSFSLKSRVIDVHLLSLEPSQKSISIYINGEKVVQRAGNCDESEYDLSYNVDEF